MITPNKLPEEIVSLLQPRLRDELTQYARYTAMANWCRGVGYEKAAAFYEKDASEELEHAQRLMKFLVDWNIIPSYPSIVAPRTTFDSLTATIEEAYKFEFKLYEDYEDTSARVFEAGDMCTFDFLQQYRTIQRTTVAEYSDKLNMLEGVVDREPEEGEERERECKVDMLLLEEKLFG